MRADVVPAGTAVEGTAIVYYTHVHAAAEFRYVLSPDPPARLKLASQSPLPGTGATPTP